MKLLRALAAGVIVTLALRLVFPHAFDAPDRPLPGVSPWLINALGPLVATLVAIFNGAITQGWHLVTSAIVIRRSVAGGADEVISVLAKKGGGLRNSGEEHYWMQRLFVRSMGQVMSVWLKNVGFSWRIAFYKKWPILIVQDDPYRFAFLRWTINFDELLLEAAREHHERTTENLVVNKRFALFRMAGSRMSNSVSIKNEAKGSGPHKSGSIGDPTVFPIGWEKEDIGISVEGSKSEDLALTPAMERVRRDARFWHAHRDWYQSRGIPWRRGYLFYGTPGGGKTSLTRALAEELDMPVFQFDLTGMSNEVFLKSWDTTKSGGSRIVLFEDFDAVFHGRENITKSEGEKCLSFDTVLNVLDGIEREDGLMLVVTTNHLQHIDPAMGVPDGNGRSTRPGRIDLAVEFEPLGHAGRVKIARRIMLDDTAAERLANEGAEDSPAQLVERCIQAASVELWASYDEGVEQPPARPHEDELSVHPTPTEPPDAGSPLEMLARQFQEIVNQETSIMHGSDFAKSEDGDVWKSHNGNPCSSPDTGVDE